MRKMTFALCFCNRGFMPGELIYGAREDKALIRKDYSHPCVIMYCIGNEITDTGLPHGAMLAQMINGLFKTEDPTRPTTIAINPMLTVLARKMAEAKSKGAENQGNMGSAEVNDIVTLLPKILAGITPESLEELLHDLLQHVDIAGYNYSAHLLEGTHTLEPDRVILHSETFPCRIADGWKLVERNNSVVGDFMWTAWDYLGEAGVGEPTYGTTQAPFSKEYPCQNAGVGAVDLTGEPEPFAYYVATLWGFYLMKTVANKELLMGADFAGYPLKEAIKEYLEKKGWKITDVGVKADSDPNDTELMFHRIGLRVGSMITEKEFDRAMIFCGTGMGIHIAASKCPGVHAGVVESVPAAFRAITGNGVNVLAMGAFYVTPELGKQCADAYLYNDFGSGWEWWPDFDRFHQIAIDELNAFDYEEYKTNGFKVKHLDDCGCELYDRPVGSSPVPLMVKR